MTRVSGALIRMEWDDGSSDTRNMIRTHRAPGDVDLDRRSGARSVAFRIIATVAPVISCHAVRQNP